MMELQSKLQKSNELRLSLYIHCLSFIIKNTSAMVFSLPLVGGFGGALTKSKALEYAAKLKIGEADSDSDCIGLVQSCTYRIFNILLITLGIFIGFCSAILNVDVEQYRNSTFSNWFIWIEGTVSCFQIILTFLKNQMPIAWTSVITGLGTSNLEFGLTSKLIRMMAPVSIARITQITNDATIVEAHMVRSNLSSINIILTVFLGVLLSKGIMYMFVFGIKYDNTLDPEQEAYFTPRSYIELIHDILAILILATLIVTISASAKSDSRKLRYVIIGLLSSYIILSLVHMGSNINKGGFTLTKFDVHMINIPIYASYAMRVVLKDIKYLDCGLSEYMNRNTTAYEVEKRL